MQDTTERKDVYSRITAQIIEHLEKGVRPWGRPWNAEHAAGRIAGHCVTMASLIPESISCPFGCPLWGRILPRQSG
jgi:hypothetical protein